MTKVTKLFIEENRELIKLGRFEDLYLLMLEEEYVNYQVVDLYKTLLAAGIDTEPIRKKLLYDLLKEACNSAFNDGVSIQTALLGYSNFLGYTLTDIYANLEKWVSEYKFMLVPTEQTPQFQGYEDYYIHRI